MLTGAIVTSGFFWIDQSKAIAGDRIESRRLNGQIFVRGQIKLDDVVAIRAAGYRTLINLRPDNEARDQPLASDIAEAAGRAGLKFTSIPVRPGTIPEEAVMALTKALQDADGPVLLYCRSGSRAARTWALAEASRPGGATVDAILDSVRSVGQSADDLKAAINQRIANRPTIPK